MKIGVVGCGVVGGAIARLFSRNPSHAVAMYDKFVPPHNSEENRCLINKSDLVYLCVPTPIAADGVSCDISAVEECVDWIAAPICIRSTVVPGTVDRLTATTGKMIAFSPEYLGEQPSHPWREDGACGFVIVGGPPAVCDLVASAYTGAAEPALQIYRTTARAAELCKYMENCFLATKVAFVNQFYDIAAALEVDFSELRQLWLADPRVGSSHTTVTGERGFRGRCLPKDLSALVSSMKPFGGAPLLEAVLRYNADLCRGEDQRRCGSEDVALQSR